MTEVTNVKWVNTEQSGVFVDYNDGSREQASLGSSGNLTTIGNGPTREAVQDWIALGNTPDSADPPPPPPTNDEIYDQVIQVQKAFKAYVLAVNDGSIVPGSNMTNAALKAAVVVNM